MLPLYMRWTLDGENKEDIATSALEKNEKKNRKFVTKRK